MIPKIIHRTLRQEAVYALQQMIVAGDLKPGERISEHEIAERMGISRGPVREALRQIEQEGLVEYTTNRGCFVREVTSRDIFETDLLQIQLELAVLELLDGVLPDKTLELMASFTESMSHLGDNTTLSDMIEEDKNFHRCIMDSVPLKRFLRIWEATSQSSIVLLQRFEQDKDKMLRLHKEVHESLLKALESKDMSVIRPAMLKHCVNAVRLQIGSDEETGFDLEILLGETKDESCDMKL